MSVRARQRPVRRIGASIAVLSALLSLAACGRMGFDLDAARADASAPPEDAAPPRDSEPPVDASRLAPPSWPVRVGATRDDAITDVAVGPTGDVYAVGWFQETLVVRGASIEPEGGTDALIVRFDSEGELVWLKALGGPGYDAALGLAVGSNGAVYVVGAFEGTARLGTVVLEGQGDRAGFVLRLGPDGRPEWTRVFAGPFSEVEAADVALSFVETLWVTGSFTGNVPVDTERWWTSAGSGTSDAFVAELTLDGEHRFSVRIGGESPDTGRAIAVSAEGDVYAVGSFASTVDLGRGLVTSAGAEDAFLVSFDSMGFHRFSRILGGPGSDELTTTAVDASGNVYVAGRFEHSLAAEGVVLESQGGSDGLLVGYRSDGALRWTDTLGGDQDDEVLGISVDAERNVHATGRFRGHGRLGAASYDAAGGLDAFASSYTPGGAPRWAITFGGPDDDEGRAIAATAAGRLVVGGSFRGSAAIGDSVSASAGGSDGYVVSLVPEGGTP